jgi:hypothetical protein
MRVTTGQNLSLDAVKVLQEWFAGARLRLPNNIAVEIRLPAKDSSQNAAMVGLVAGDIVCSISLSGGASIDYTILAYTRATSNYGAIEYIVQDMKPNKNLRCKDIMLDELPQVVSNLDECFDDFLKLASTL